jgi:hypothetical protein
MMRPFLAFNTNTNIKSLLIKPLLPPPAIPRSVCIKEFPNTLQYYCLSKLALLHTHTHTNRRKKPHTNATTLSLKQPHIHCLSVGPSVRLDRERVSALACFKLVFFFFYFLDTSSRKPRKKCLFRFLQIYSKRKLAQNIKTPPKIDTKRQGIAPRIHSNPSFSCRLSVSARLLCLLSLSLSLSLSSVAPSPVSLLCFSAPVSVPASLAHSSRLSTATATLVHWMKRAIIIRQGDDNNNRLFC